MTDLITPPSCSPSGESARALLARFSPFPGERAGLNTRRENA
jgi:hypothetical protein